MSAALLRGEEVRTMFVLTGIHADGKVELEGTATLDRSITFRVECSAEIVYKTRAKHH